MLKKRLLTGGLLTLLVVVAILYLPLPLFTAFSTMLILFAAWEWGLLMNCRSKIGRVLYVCFVGIVMFSTWFLPVSLVLYLALGWWLIAFGLIFSYPFLSKWWSKGWWIRSVMGIFVLVPSWLSLNVIRFFSEGIRYTFLILFLVWAADIGAYFAGRGCGKHKLASKVSPKKTWEGFFGGGLLSLIVGGGIGWLYKFNLRLWPKMLFLIVIVTLFSVIGDLLESMLKREVGVKDTGNYLPGHGGVLDRIDSLNAALPVFLLLCFIFGWYR